MGIPRVYQSGPLTSETVIPLDTQAAHHLARVLRLQSGDPLKIFNGEGGEYAATIASITKQQVLVKIAEYTANNYTESPLAIHLGQGISRGEKMDYTIQKAVELGVNEITPLLTERCGVKLSDDRWEKRLQHWRAVIISACEQCGRDKLAKIHEPMLLTEWIKQSHAGLKLVLEPTATETLRSSIKSSPTAASLIIGPEGGISATELQAATQVGFQPVKLGPRILRTETAALTAITALQCRLGDLG